MTATRRIFFLGAHKILVKTELPRLRALGFEVFCPPYRLKSTQHQSATRDWDADQPTTLPRTIFDELTAYNFFFNTISPRIARLLHEHFDAMIVTSDPAWLVEVLRAYSRKVLFRTYGQVLVLSDWLFSRDAFRSITERDDFWFVPHAAEAVVPEHAWLKERMEIVPYVPSLDALSMKDTWKLDDHHDREIMLACPNLTNPYYRDHYAYLKRHFSEPHFRYYGVQAKPVDDTQVVGTLDDDTYFKRFARAAGFLYTYREPTVCFLPPIEMMIAGGPVIFLEGSLLSNAMPTDAPGRARSEREAKDKCRALLAGDRSFSQDIIRSQAALRERYFPENVWPTFDDVLPRLLARETGRRGRVLASSILEAERVSSSVYALAHRRADPIRFVDGRYETADARLQAFRERLREVDDVVITCRKRHLPSYIGFFGAQRRFLCVDDDLPVAPRRVTFAASRPLRIAQRIAGRARREARKARARAPHRLLALINGDAACTRVLVDDETAYLAPFIHKPLERL